VNVLVVEQSPKQAMYLVHLLQEEGYLADICYSGVEALKHGQSQLYNLILLDWILPDLDGLSICRELRQLGVTTPILMLTARAALEDRVLALRTGVDDYLIDPFEMDELLARINALLRRSSGLATLRAGALSIDQRNRKMLLSGRTLKLTIREYAFLLHLLHRLNKPVSHSELLTQVLGASPDTHSNAILAMVHQLREKFGEYSWMLRTQGEHDVCLCTEPPASG
jgi:DNA-binding response OmpR family regulator